MAGFNLVSYIREQLSKGYSREQVTAFLQRYGYPMETIEGAFARIQKRPFLSRIFAQKRQLNMQLVNYFQQNLAMGHDIGSISAFLSRYNYDPRDIRKAAEYAQKHSRQMRHVIDVSNKAFLLVILLLVGGSLIAGALYFINRESPKKLLDYKIDLEKSSVMPGEKLYFTNTFVNMGSQRRYDIILEYKVVNTKTGVAIYEKGETIGISMVDTSSRIIEIPDDAKPGSYRLEGVARYGSDIATSYANFNIAGTAQQPSCDDGIQNQDEDGIDCGGVCSPCAKPVEESCSDGVQNQDEDGIDCGGVCSPCAKPVEESCSDGVQNQDEDGIDCGGVCSPCTEPAIRPDNRKILEKVQDMGDYNEQESLRLCNTVDSQQMRDDCFIEMSQIFNTSKYCSNIVGDSKMNTCYMRFVMEGDYSVCSKISDVYLKRSCESLDQINKIQSSGNITLESS